MMKANVNIECTAEEAREFFGMPDVKPVQDRLVKEMEDRLIAGIKKLDPEQMLQSWFPIPNGMEQFQAMLTQMAAQMTGAKK